MKWIFDTPAVAEFQNNSIDVDDCVAVMCEIGEYRSSLVGNELDLFDNMSAVRRQRTFSSGRHCVRLAQRFLGLGEHAILAENRAPVWPDGVGSISHTDEYAVATLGRGSTSVGVDIEEVGRVHEDMWRVVFTEAERSTLDPELAAVAFSAKEAGYKAIYPIGRKFIGFHEAEININKNTQTFTIRYLGDHEPNQALGRGRGWFSAASGHVLTYFSIDLCKP
jgi:4'-phosphopantetheinyl transferase EntD